MASTKTNSDPWRAPLGVAQIPDAGLHREIEADAQARRVIAELAGLRDVLSAQASFDVTPKSGGRFHVTGRVRARIGQVCVVTLDPIENDIDEGIDVVFAPPELIPTRIAPAEDVEEGDDAQEPDPPEPIVNGFIDLGRLATDALFLGIDPYPRKPGAVFEPRVAAADPEDHPFAALQALKGDARSPEGRKPKPK